jgi:hypothetical protein
VLPKLAYFALCRSIQLLAQLGRSHAARDLEILKENPRWATSASKENSKPFGKRVSATAIRATLRRRLDPAPRPASTTGARSCANRPQKSSPANSPSTPHRSVRRVDGAEKVIDKPESVTVAA